MIKFSPINWLLFLLIGRASWTGASGLKPEALTATLLACFYDLAGSAFLKRICVPNT